MEYLNCWSSCSEPDPSAAARKAKTTSLAVRSERCWVRFVRHLATVDLVSSLAETLFVSTSESEGIKVSSSSLSASSALSTPLSNSGSFSSKNL